MSDQVEEDMVAFIDYAVPEVTVNDIPGWSETDRSVQNLHCVLVKLDPFVADMTLDGFQDAVMDSDESSVFDQLVEVYDRDDGDAVFRITGHRVDDAPRYYVDSVNAVLVLHGAYCRDNVAIALYDPDAFDDHAHKYLDSYRLFDVETRENRADEIRHTNSIMDRMTPDAFEDDVDELRDASEGELDEYFDEYHDESDDRGLDDLF